MNVSGELFLFHGCFIAVNLLFYCMIASFNDKNCYIFAHKFVPLAMKRNALQLVNSSAV